MATTSRRPMATRTIAIGLLLITVCAALWFVFVRTEEHQRTVVRLTQSVAAGEYLTGADIEAVQITVGSNAQEYVTTGQAGSGLIAAHDLTVGDVLLVSSVYTTGQQPAPEPPASTTPSDVGALDLLAITAGIVGILGFAVWVVRRQPSPHPSRPGAASVPTNRAPGWLHLEVNTWITEDGDWDQRAWARPRTEGAGTATGQTDRRAISRDVEFVLTPGSGKVDRREWHDAESQRSSGAADAPAADEDTAPVQPASVLDTPTTEASPDLSDSAEAASFESFKPTPADMDSSTHEAVPETPMTDESGLESGQPFALLQVFGDVKVHGVPVSQAAAAPFILAAAGRPMSTDELVELTGYAAKTFSSVYPASHPIVARTKGMLTLAPGVWTDHSWLAETVRRAAGSLRNEQNAETAEWLRQADDAIAESLQAVNPHGVSATTFAGVWLSASGRGNIAHVGDARVLLLRSTENNWKIEQLTRDQTYAEMGEAPPTGGSPGSSSCVHVRIPSCCPCWWSLGRSLWADVRMMMTN